MTKSEFENVTVYLAHNDDPMRSLIEQMLKTLGHRVPVVTDSGTELIRANAEHPPDLLISGVRLADMDGIDALIQCCEREPVPSIVIALIEDREKVEEALKDHVMAYLTEPVELADLRPSIFLVLRRFEEFQELRRENRELKSALEGRKWIERAKGLLMKGRDLDEGDAFKTLQRMASDNRKKLVDVARTLVEANDLLRP